MGSRVQKLDRRGASMAGLEGTVALLLSGRWYVQTDAGEVGPITGRQLRQMARDGGLNPQTMVRPESALHWTRAGQVQGLFSDAPAEQGSVAGLVVPGPVTDDRLLQARRRRLVAASLGIMLVCGIVAWVVVTMRPPDRGPAGPEPANSNPGRAPNPSPPSTAGAEGADEAYLKESLRLAGYPGVAKSLAFSADGRWLLSGGGMVGLALPADIALSADQAASPAGRSSVVVWLWDVRSGTRLKELAGHTALVRATAFSPDARWAVSADASGTAVLWDVRQGARLQRFEGSHRTQDGLPTMRTINAVAFSADSQRVLLAGSGRSDPDSLAEMNKQAQLVVWDLETGREVVRRTAQGKTRPFFEPPPFTDEFHSVAWTADGQYVIVGASGSEAGVYYYDREGQVYAATTPASRAAWNSTTPPGEGTANALAPTPPGRSTGHDWPTVSFVFAAVSPKGEQVVSGDTIGRLCLWAFSPNPSDPSKGVDRLADTQLYDKSILCVAFSPDGRYFATGGDDLYLWAAGSSRLTVVHELGPKPVGAFRARPYHVHSVAFSPSGRLLAAGCDDQIIRLWKVP